ncbi:MAG TPA: twin-arginine translocation signal domain-containing protein, partial [Burkholderiales bacterium]|nr:twin-arginine translocation signal domain-containing protein [Burkholderiales bacterium]
MSLDEKAADFCPLNRRQFLTASAALGAAVLIPGSVHAAEVRELAGSVKVNGKPATRKTRVRPGDVVETGSKSKVIFVIGQDA